MLRRGPLSPHRFRGGFAVRSLGGNSERRQVSVQAGDSQRRWCNIVFFLHMYVYKTYAFAHLHLFIDIRMYHTQQPSVILMRDPVRYFQGWGCLTFPDKGGPWLNAHQIAICLSWFFFLTFWVSPFTYSLRTVNQQSAWCLLVLYYWITRFKRWINCMS